MKPLFWVAPAQEIHSCGVIFIAGSIFCGYCKSKRSYDYSKYRYLDDAKGLIKVAEHIQLPLHRNVELPDDLHSELLLLHQDPNETWCHLWRHGVISGGMVANLHTKKMCLFRCSGLERLTGGYKSFFQSCTNHKE